MHTRSLIELAMDRVARKAPDGTSRAVSAVSTDPRLGRREYDQALLRRHEQLRTAPGDEDPTAPAPPPTESLPSSATVGHAYGRGTILLASVVTALGTAGLMWLTIGSVDRGDVAPMPPAAVIPSAAPEATVKSSPAIVAVAAPAASPVDVGETQARDLVERWRRAWASRDVEAYLGCYSPDFLSADGQTHIAWAAARRKKLSSQSDINVQVHDIRLERIDGEQLRAVFLQDYASGTYRESARPKTLLLVRMGDDWRIAGEWQGTPPAAVGGR